MTILPVGWPPASISKYTRGRAIFVGTEEKSLKKETEEEWPRLREEKQKVQWIKVDWKRWKDEDDEDEGAAAPFDMTGMDDMNFGDMGGDDFDSDDEDLPDLDPGVPMGGDGAKEGAEEAKEGGAKAAEEEKELEKID